MAVASLIFRPLIDWTKRVVVQIAALELAEDASIAAGRSIEPAALEGIVYPALPAPIGTGPKSKRS